MAELVDGVFTASEVYLPEQLTEALVRFQELEAEELALSPDAPATSGVGPTVELTNAAVRKMEELAAVFAALDWARAAKLYPDDPVAEDRRTGVNSGSTSGPAQMIEFLRSLADVGFTTVDHVPVAIRGERLALLRRTWRRPDGFVLPVLVVVELDADGLFATNVMFDPDDLASALDELDRRYLVGAGAEHEQLLRPIIEFWR